MNIHPAYRSTIRSIQLLAVAKSADMKRYGFDAVIKPAIDDLKRLANDVSACICTLRVCVCTVFCLNCYGDGCGILLQESVCHTYLPIFRIKALLCVFALHVE